MKKRYIPCTSEDMRKVKKMDMEEDQRMGITRDIGMENEMDTRKDIMRGSIEDYGLEQHGLYWLPL
jgi:hypothetical protein